MQCAIYRGNSGQLHWCLGRRRAKAGWLRIGHLHAPDAHRAAADVAVHAGSADGTEVR